MKHNIQYSGKEVAVKREGQVELCAECGDEFWVVSITGDKLRLAGLGYCTSLGAALMDERVARLRARVTELQGDVRDILLHRSGRSTILGEANELRTEMAGLRASAMERHHALQQLQYVQPFA